ncbi:MULTISPECIES: hypothetical protein [Rhodomicrobium]|uniref:hypothetical protein n=1 Tax=Rhodomicrobium TaxID=1068 RepID=UPI000B4BEDA2|nr:MULTISPECIES: hypothetical protein [Rhodomicrobium]
MSRQTVADDFGSRLALLERHAQSTEKRLDNVDSALGRIEAALSKAEGRPAFEPMKILSFVKDAGILIGMGAAAIIFISTSINSSPMAVMESQLSSVMKRLEAVETALRWKTEFSDARR